MQSGKFDSERDFARGLKMSSSETLLKRTALFKAHQEAGGKMVPFAGEFFISGQRTQEALNYLLTNDVAKLQPGEGQYTFLLNPQGGVIDDLIIYCLEKDSYFLVVNASKIEEDFAWLKRHLPNEVTLSNRSDDFSALALQGPKAISFFQEAFRIKQAPIRFHLNSFFWEGEKGYVARTGYTGEDGVEIFLPNNKIVSAWNSLLKLGMKPAGLGARDSLRLEACYPLNGSDLNETTTPLEAGLGFAVALNKTDFIGKKVLLNQKEKGVAQKLIAFSIKEKGALPRSHYSLKVDGIKVGEVTSGGFSSALNKGIGMGYVTASYAVPGQELTMEVRGQEVPVVIERKPLYKS